MIEVGGKFFKEYTVYHPIIEKLFETDEDLPEHVKQLVNTIDPISRVNAGNNQKVHQYFFHS